MERCTDLAGCFRESVFQGRLARCVPALNPCGPEPVYCKACVKSALVSSLPDDLAVRLSSAGLCSGVYERLVLGL